MKFCVALLIVFGFGTAFDFEAPSIKFSVSFTKEMSE
jgi:hypothetical protein